MNTNPSRPQISIITVVFNSEKYLEGTILSIINQTYKNIQYIIIDGGSTDSTVDIIKKYEDQIYYWVSEPDKGLYDAMNKGMNKATGEYLWFINSGDKIFEKDTVESIFSEKKDYTDIYYGETVITDENNNIIGMRRLKTPESLNWKSFQKGMLVCHQAIIVRRNVTVPININYRHSADFDWIIRILRKNPTITNTKKILVKFLDGGVSKKTIKKSLFERFHIMRENYGLIPTILNHFIIGVKFFGFLFRYKRF
ncbi:MAG: glycosyltransferase family 2 protein [Bacteroidota bacterium]|nr:glycosyltransferase family 2 protein [Bacteroidota bacterium]